LGLTKNLVVIIKNVKEWCDHKKREMQSYPIEGKSYGTRSGI